MERKYAIKVLGGKRPSSAVGHDPRGGSLACYGAAEQVVIPHGQITWKAVKGPDFDVYYGTAMPPLSGGSWLLQGDHPQKLSGISATIIEGKLGIMPVRWYKVRREDGTLEQRTQVHFGSTYTGDIWVYSTRQSDLDALIKELSSYPMFSRKA